MKQYRNLSSTMETETILKNEASSKSHMSRRIFRYFYLILIIAGIIGRFEIQAQDFVSFGEVIDGIRYILWDTNEATVTRSVDVGMNEYSGDIVIPSSIVYKGVNYSVTEIGYQAFSNCPELNSVVMPNTVKKIGLFAFEDCQNYNSLKSVTLSNTLEEIGVSAFIGCKELKSLNLPNSLKRIDDDAFAWCKFNSITIPASVTHIGHYIFRETEIGSISVDSDNPFFSSRDNVIYSKDFSVLITCPSNIAAYYNSIKEAFVIPNTVKKIEDYAFAFCYYSSVTIPESVEDIGDGVFWGVRYVIKIDLNVNNKSFKILDDALYNKDITELVYFFKNTGRMNVTIPNTVKKIYGSAFNGGYSNENRIVSISLPKSLEHIGYQAVRPGYNSLTEIYSYNPIPPKTETYEDFYEIVHCKLFVPNGSQDAYSSADGWKYFNNIIEMADATATEKISSDNIHIYATTNGIVIQSDETLPVSVYSITGQKIVDTIIQGIKQISLGKGIYLVHIGKTSKKVFVY